MIRSRPITFLAGAAVIPLAAMAVAACGGSGSGATAATTRSTSTPSPKATKTQTAKVAVGDSRLGKILVDSTGRTLYLFKADSGSMSACSGACAVAWPPLLTGATPTVGMGVASSKLGTISRSGGSRQVTYNGHPLYLFIKDHKAGDVLGQGVTAFGAAWFAVSPAGKQISSKPATPGAASSSRPAPPTTQPAAKPRPAPKPTPQATTTQATTPPAAQPAPPAAKPAPTNGIPQNNGGDGDSDNNGGPSDGDGNI